MKTVLLAPNFKKTSKSSCTTTTAKSIQNYTEVQNIYNFLQNTAVRLHNKPTPLPPCLKDVKSSSDHF